MFFVCKSIDYCKAIHLDSLSLSLLTSLSLSLSLSLPSLPSLSLSLSPDDACFMFVIHKPQICLRSIASQLSFRK